MQANAKVEHILHTLSDPEEYVRGIIENFFGEGFDRDKALVRIGVSGTGTFPHYCIEQGRTTTAVQGAGEIGAYERRAIFHGKSHKPILDDQFKGVSWSSAGNTFAEVQTLLGRLRASRRAH